MIGLLGGHVKQAPARLLGLDALRGLSALAVLICHIGAYWPFLNLPGKGLQITQIGAHGVDVFVVLSGFCLALPFADRRNQLNVAQFFGRRALRILPAYWAALAVAAALAMSDLTWRRVVGAQAGLFELLIHIPGLQTIATDVIGTINGSLWSVSLEMQLYLLFPLAIFVWRRWGRLPLLLMAAATALLWALTPHLLDGLPFPFASLLGDAHAVPARFIQFAAGIVAVDLVAERRLPTGRLGAIATFVGLILATGGTTLEVPYWLDSLLWAAAGALCVGLVTGPWFSTPIRDTLDGFGLRTFSFYLLHQPILLLSGPVVASLPGGWPVQLLVGLITMVILVGGAAEVLYRLVELPSHALGKRLFPRVIVRSQLPRNPEHAVTSAG